MKLIENDQSNDQARPAGSQAAVPGKEDYVSLIIRLWRAQGDEASIQGHSWRSEVEHIQSGRQSKFSELGELESYLQTFLRHLEKRWDCRRDTE